MRKSSPKSHPTLSLRIYLDEGHIGHGKIELLENIRSCGSISAAGRAMNMSYRRAWLLVNEMNRMCGQAVVETHEGGKHGFAGLKRSSFQVHGHLDAVGGIEPDLVA